MAEEREILAADLRSAADMPASRLSEIARALAIRGRAARGGTAVSRFTTAEAVAIVITRRLQALGLPLGEAAKAVRIITEQHFRKIITTDAPTWLVVSAERAEVADAERVLALAEGHGGSLQGLRLVRIDLALRDILGTKLQREQSMMNQHDAETVVSPVRLSERISGAFLGRDLSLTISRVGDGLSLRLDPEAARELARELWALAEAAAPEVKN